MTTGLTVTSIIMFAAVELICLAAIVMAVRYDLHMFQLSSYQQQGYYRVMRTHPAVIASGITALVCLIIFAVLSGNAASALILLISAAVTCFVFFPRKAKKKFVVTARVKRQIAVVCALFAVMLVIAIPVTSGMQVFPVFTAILFIEGLWLSFHTLLISLCGLMVSPVEKNIQKGFIKDAVRMINEHPGLKIIGITGSFGKTSVKHYLTEILSEKYSVLMTPGSFNTPMGVVRTIRENLRPTHEIFVCEMGARHVGDIKEICDIVHPADAVITAIGDQHLETFHTRENIIKTKFELLDATPNGIRLVNGDDENIRAAAPDNVITYGMNEGNDYRSEILSVDMNGTRFLLTTPHVIVRDGQEMKESAQFEIPLVGRHNVINATGAIAAACELGVPLDKCRRAARRLKPAEHRLEVKKMPYGAILDDAYNANPAGARAALEALGSFDSSMLKILVTPGMVELGEKQAEYNSEFGAEAAKVCDYIFTVGKTNSEAIAEGAKKASYPAEKISACATIQEAMKKAVSLETGRPRAILLENDLPDDY
ncbi:MAG: UDP-N-acetylmuramoyl-tripeptide--D-alanyl-D-alanine ligase [Lachnospiraceae bacterium]|nr:UDP-N-acetylmuramoyl-tripeptide--D-alanyl-D-alanine ligase [Lachnospiraceae bacterium]